MSDPKDQESNETPSTPPPPPPSQPIDYEPPFRFTQDPFSARDFEIPFTGDGE